MDIPVELFFPTGLFRRSRDPTLAFAYTAPISTPLSSDSGCQTNARLNLQTGGGEDHTTLSLRDHDFLSTVWEFQFGDLRIFRLLRSFLVMREDLRLCGFAALRLCESLRGFVELHSLVLTNSFGTDRLRRTRGFAKWSLIVCDEIRLGNDLHMSKN